MASTYKYCVVGWREKARCAGRDVTMSDRCSVSGFGRGRLLSVLGVSEELPKSAPDVLLLFVLGKFAMFGLRALLNGQLASFAVG